MYVRFEAAEIGPPWEAEIVFATGAQGGVSSRWP